MNPENGFPELEPEQLQKLHQRVAVNETDMSADIKMADTMSTPTTDTVNTPPSSIFNDRPGNIQDIKNRVKSLENELSLISDKKEVASIDRKTFRDEMGNETFYVQNVSGTHIVISDIPGLPRIGKGEVTDLLVSASLEEIHASRDLRKLLNSLGKQYLKRLTELEFFEERERILNQQKKIAIIKQQEAQSRAQQQNTTSNKELLPHERIPQDFASTHAIRPVVEAKLGQLALRSDKNPENVKLALSGVEFVKWVEETNLSDTEIDHILGHPAVSHDHNIKAALLEKKRTV